MQQDEQKHAAHALVLGGLPLPKPIRIIMTALSKIMTLTTRFI
jgi:ubiquinone biosynthesis monooxygenase Coq7